MIKDNILLGKIDDLIEKFERENIELTSDFFDLRQKSLVISHLKKIGVKNGLFNSISKNFERDFLILLPEYKKTPDFDDIAVIRIFLKEKTKSLKHSDYLGAILGLGIKREKVGDISAFDDGADIIIKRELLSFLNTHLTSVGRQNIDFCEIDIQDLREKNNDYENIKVSISSLRLDNIVASIFNISRTKATEYIKQGKVFVNDVEVDKIDSKVHSEDKITLRGFGRSYITITDSFSKKNKQYVLIKKYVRK